MELLDKRKSRDQRFYEFFITLQKEYIVAELRKKIYPDVTGKKKSEEIMSGKKKKIFDMSMKNRIGTIFPDMKLGEMSLYDEELRIKLYHEVYGDFGIPQFIYRDKSQEDKLGKKDRNCYWMLGSEVATRDNKIGNLQNVDFERSICFVKIGNKLIDYNFNDVKRIL